MIAVILAGGLGTRLKPFTEIIPKPLLPIGEKSILEIQLNQLQVHGFKTVYIATNYMSEYIENYFRTSDLKMNLIFSKEKIPLGTVGPLSLLKDKLDEPFILMNGDILTQLNFRNFYKFAESIDSNLIVGIKKYITPFQFGDVKFKGDFISMIEEKPNFINYILAGIYILKPEIFKYIPHNKKFGIDQLIRKMLNRGEQIAKYEIKEYWLDIGQIDDYNQAQEVYANHFKKNNQL